MSLGSTVRRMFGRHERAVSDLWRSLFIDLDDLRGHFRQWVPDAERILEIGCGEGGVTECLAEAFPDAEILGIDIAETVGRMYRGGRDRVTFRQVTVQDLVSEKPQRFDMIVMCDVMHHVPLPLRHEILSAARDMLAPRGHFVFKDWVRTATPIHAAAFAADRWLTGDEVHFMSRAEATELVAQGFAASTIREEARIKPWQNNFALVLQAAA